MKNILLVEDEWLVRSGMKAMVDWEANGFQLIADVSHGGEALTVLQEQPVDIVLTDIRMPVMDGLTLIETIREQHYACEVIILSSYDDFHYVRQAMQHGVRDYIHKPTLSPEELVHTLKKIAKELDEKQSLEQYRRMMEDVAGESRHVLLKKILQEMANRRFTDIDGLLTKIADSPSALEEAFYLCLLRGINEQPSPLFSIEHYIRSFMAEQYGGDSDQTLVVKENDTWILLLPEQSEGILHRLEQHAKDAFGWTLIWEMAEQRCAVSEMAAIYEQVRYKLSLQQKLLGSRHPSIRKAIHYIHEHYMNSLTLEKVSTHVNMSPSYFSRLFLKEKKMPFIEYVTDFRLKEAKRLLLQTDLPVYQIAKRVGYQNSKYFLNLFKRHFHVTPGKFRQENSGSNGQ